MFSTTDTAARATHRRNARDPIAPLNLTRAARITREERERETWRRISGITLGHEPFMDGDERKAGIKRMAEWIEDRVKSSLAEREKIKTPEPQPSYFFPTRAALEIGCTTDWLPAIDAWARATSAVESIESICQSLGLTPGALSRLTREWRDISAEELIDGLKLRRLKHELIIQLKRAACELWGQPGDLADTQCFNQTRDGTHIPHDPKNWRELSDWRRDSNRRGAELCDRLDGIRASGAPDEKGRALLNLQSLSLKLGFGTASRLKRACLNVFGRSLHEIELQLAKEIAYYYACVEEKVLRDSALQPKLTPFVARARYLYHGDDEAAPIAPFLDLWSAVAECQPGWTDDMKKLFG